MTDLTNLTPEGRAKSLSGKYRLARVECTADAVRVGDILTDERFRNQFGFEVTERSYSHRGELYIGHRSVHLKLTCSRGLILRDDHMTHVHRWVRKATVADMNDVWGTVSGGPRSAS